MSALLFRETLHGRTELVADVAEGHGCRTLLGYDVVVSGCEQLLVLPKKFTNQPLQVIPHDCVAHLTADRDPDTRCDKWRVFPEDDKVSRMELTPLFGNEQELGPFPEPVVPGKTMQGSALILRRW